MHDSTAKLARVSADKVDLSVHIRKMTRDDRHLNTIAAWLFNQWGHLYPRKTLANVAARIAEDAAGDIVPSVYLAEIDGLPVATASIVACDLPLRRQYTPWMAAVYVQPDFRRRGIANLIINHVESVAAASHIQRLFLFTPDQQPLYGRLGWTHLEELNYTDMSVTVMERLLL